MRTGMPGSRSNQPSRRARTFLALGVVGVVAVSVAAVSLLRVGTTNQNLTNLADNNVARLQVFIEIRGGLAMIVNGVAQLTAPEPDLAIKAHLTEIGTQAVHDGRATVEASLAQYHRLAAGTPTEADHLADAARDDAVSAVVGQASLETSGETSAPDLAEMAQSLNAMISLFVTTHDEPAAETAGVG